MLSLGLLQTVSIIHWGFGSHGHFKQIRMLVSIENSSLGCNIWFWSAKGIASPLLTWGSLCMTPSHMFLSIESRVWLSYGMWVKNPKTIVFWRSKTSSMKPRKTEKSSQHTLMEPQNLEARTEIVDAVGYLSSMISSDKGKYRLNTLKGISDRHLLSSKLALPLPRQL